MPVFSSTLKSEYQQLFDTCLIRPEKYSTVDSCIRSMLATKPKYEAVAARTNIPWYFIAIVHNMECSGSFTCHLHNGDPLTARTVKVPKNHPKTGAPPFSWEDSAEDALRLRSLHKWSNWSVPGMLFQLEGYNGFGYRPKGINSPYLWSFSNHYTKGKFTADGLFNPSAVSKQIGAAVLLRRLSEQQVAPETESDLISRIKQAGEQVSFNPNRYHAQAEALQLLLNSAGFHLRVDGKAGRRTSDAYFKVTGTYLAGDPQAVPKGKK